MPTKSLAPLMGFDFGVRWTSGNSGGLGMETGDLFALKLLDRHRVQGSDPRHPVLA
jgi:hypothetical protein